uniref:Uncharacterized protein n=1 Tax=Rhizophora mucronata TaxID=61149 RepID=A0A2P2QNW0_RHIMU
MHIFTCCKFTLTSTTQIAKQSKTYSQQLKQKVSRYTKLPHCVFGKGSNVCIFIFVFTKVFSDSNWRLLS